MTYNIKNVELYHNYTIDDNNIKIIKLEQPFIINNNRYFKSKIYKLIIFDLKYYDLNFFCKTEKYNTLKKILHNNTVGLIHLLIKDNITKSVIEDFTLLSEIYIDNDDNIYMHLKNAYSLDYLDNYINNDNYNVMIDTISLIDSISSYKKSENLFQFSLGENDYLQNIYSSDLYKKNIIEQVNYLIDSKRFKINYEEEEYNDNILYNLVIKNEKLYYKCLNETYEKIEIKFNAKIDISIHSNKYSSYNNIYEADCYIDSDGINFKLLKTNKIGNYYFTDLLSNDIILKTSYFDESYNEDENKYEIECIVNDINTITINYIDIKILEII